MTVEEIKEILRSARRAERAYRSADNIAKAFREQLTGGRSAGYESGGKPERQENSTENDYIRLSEYQAEADRLFSEMTAAGKRAERLISTADDPVQREVLTRRYIFGQRWEDIAESMNYSLRRVYQLHGYAIQNIALNCTISL